MSKNKKGRKSMLEEERMKSGGGGEERDIDAEYNKIKETMS